MLVPPRALTVAICLCASLATSPVVAQFPNADPPYQTGFPVTLDGLQALSPPALGDIDGDGKQDIVVGGRDGKVHAYTGTGAKLWDFDTGNMGIAGKAAIGDIDGDSFNEVVIGAAHVIDQTAAHGGLYVISHQGQLQCEFMTADFGNGFRGGVFASPALADLDGDDGGRLEIAFGSWDHRIRAIHHDCSVLWDLFQIPETPPIEFFFDSVWSSPAIADINGDGQIDVITGTDSADNAPNLVPVGGGIFAFDGKTGELLPGFPFKIDEVIWSSPGLADLTGDGSFDIAVGSGNCWEVAACAPPPAGVQPVNEALFAWSAGGDALPGWPFDLSAAGNEGMGTYAMASPVLVDLDEDGAIEVIINTIEREDINGGQFYAFDGDGSILPGWPVRPVTPSGPGTTVSFSTAASAVVADLTGDGDLEVVLPSNWDLVVFDKNGNQLSRDSFPTAAGDFELVTNGPVSMAAVGDVDGDGDLEVVASGFATQAPPVGAIYVWDFPGAAAPAPPWPVFRRSADNNGRVDFGVFIDGFESGDTSRWSTGL